MAPESTSSGNGTSRIPLPQVLLDDVVLLLVAGFVVPTVLYLVWGLVSLLSVPPLSK